MLCRYVSVVWRERGVHYFVSGMSLLPDGSGVAEGCCYVSRWVRLCWKMLLCFQMSWVLLKDVAVLPDESNVAEGCCYVARWVQCCWRMLLCFQMSQALLKDVICCYVAWMNQTLLKDVAMLPDDSDIAEGCCYVARWLRRCWRMLLCWKLLCTKLLQRKGLSSVTSGKSCTSGKSSVTSGKSCHFR